MADDVGRAGNDSRFPNVDVVGIAQLSPCVRAGVVVVNAGTHGSEPHMGFGGVKQSGTGWREPGVEALDVYSEWKYVNLISDPAKA